MARIEIYANDNNVTLGDKIIGTDELDNSTKNFTVGDVVALANSGGAVYTAGTGISILNGVISSTIVDTDTNTTYDFGTVGAAGNISFAVTGSNNTNDVVVMQAGANITLTDNGSNTFTIDAAGGTNSFVSGVALNGTTLEFTSSTGAFNGNVPLAGIADQIVQIAGANGITVAGTYPIFTIDGSALATPYTAGTGINISNGVISSTVVDTDTTYDLTSIVAGGDAYITLAGSDNTNDSVVIHPGANVSFTSPGAGEFTIDVAQHPAYSWGLSSDSGALNPVPSAATVTVEGDGGISTSISGNTLTISGVLEEKLVQSLGGNITVNAGGTSDVIFRNVVQGGKDITAHSVWYNPTSFVLNGYIVQVPASAPSTLYARLAIGALIDAGGNNQDMTFSLMKSTSGTTTVLKAVDFESNKAGVHPFSFFSYLPLEPGSNYWIAVSSTTGGVTLQAESQLEWAIQN